MYNQKEHLKHFSTERLFLLGGRRESRHPGIEYDVAIAQDIMRHRFDVDNLLTLMHKEHDFSYKGDSFASWLFRLGGESALTSWLLDPHTDKYHAIIVAGYMIESPDWMRNLARF